MSREYLHIKNYLHNELGVSEEYIEKIVDKYVSDQLTKILTDKLESNWMSRIIESKIGQILSGKPKVSMFQDTLADYIKEEIRKQVKEEVVKRIEFKSINVQ
jgi:Glu-tRNA(Gln) amidotransferase subunit E-like FAD-binding protein